MIKYIYLLFLLIISFFYFSCNTITFKNENESSQNDTILNFKTTYKRGVINKMISATDINLGYSFYLPKDSFESYPLLIMLDPQGKSDYVVSLYQSLAEKYNVIIASPSNTKNQQPINELQKKINYLITDIKTFLPIDSEQIYLGGFSGMARATYALIKNKTIFKGIFGIGAGNYETFPWIDSSFKIIMLAGFKDMNFSEVFESSFQQKNVSWLYTAFFYDDIHHWPDDNIFEYVFLAFFGKKYPNYTSTYVLNQFEESKKIPLRDIWKKTLILQSLKSLCHITQYYQYPFNEIEKFLNSYDTKTSIKQLQNIISKEKSNKEQLFKAFTEKDTSWWSKTINFYKNISNKTILSPADYKDIRLLNFISLVAYTYSRNALNQGDMYSSRKFLSIYQLADPYNPDMFYLYAVYFAKNNEPSKAINYLSQATKFGFSDISLIQSEPAFNTIRDSLRFNEILNNIK